MSGVQRELISIVTTLRNEEKNLVELIRQLRASLSGLGDNYEIIFVDDDSTDTSFEILSRFAAEDKKIKLLRTSRRFGVYECLFGGLRYAKGAAVIYLESDLQDPPELIPEMIRQWRDESADVVHTTRKERLGETWFKIKLTQLAYRIINKISEVPIPENTGDYKLLSRRALDHLLTMTEFDPYYRGLVSWVGFKQTYVYFSRKARFSGTSQRGIMSLAPLKVFLSAITSFSNLPLFLVFVPAVVLSAFLIFFPIGFCLDWFSIRDLLGIAICLQVIIGIFIFGFMGAQNLYIARIFKQIRSRPSFIVSEEINF